MKDKNRSLTLIIIMVGLLFVISFAAQYANHPPAPKAAEETKTEGDDHPALGGKPALDFKLPSVEGRIVSLSNFKDKNFVVLLFATAQQTDIMSTLGMMDRLEKKYGAQGVKGVVVNMRESIAKTREFAKKNGIKRNLLADINGAVAMQYIQVGMANCFVINKNGTIYAPLMTRYPKDREGALDKMVQDMLNGKPAPEPAAHGGPSPVAGPAGAIPH